MPRRKKNPNCRDGRGFLPIPACKGIGPLVPTKKYKHSNGKTYTLVEDVGRSVAATAKRLVADGYDVVVAEFPMGIGLYRRGRKTSKANRFKVKKTDTPKKQSAKKKKARDKARKAMGMEVSKRNKARAEAKRKKNPAVHTYKGHQLKRAPRGYVVLPYGAGPFTRAEAHNWVDRHVADTCATLRKNPHQAFGVSRGYRTKAESLAQSPSKITRSVLRRKR